MVGYINDTDVFVRTELGSNELASRDDGMVPREARTLLIFFDGQKNYAQIAESLEQRNLFKRSGGVRQHMQMLVDLEYVVCKPAGSNLTNAKATLSKASDHQEVILVNKAGDQTKGSLSAKGSLLAKGSLSAKGSLPAKGSLSLAKRSEQPVKNISSATESLRTIVSSLINKHANVKSGLAYKRRLAQCQDMRAIFELVQEMQRASSDEFELALYMTALAFKKSKVSKPSLKVANAS